MCTGSEHNSSCVLSFFGNFGSSRMGCRTYRFQLKPCTCSPPSSPLQLLVPTQLHSSAGDRTWVSVDLLGGGSWASRVKAFLIQQPAGVRGVLILSLTCSPWGWLPVFGCSDSPTKNISLLGERACQNCSNRFSSWVATMIVLEPTVCLGGPSWGKLTGPILLAPSSLRSSFSMTMLVSFGGSPCTHSGFGKIVTFNFSP